MRVGEAEGDPEGDGRRTLAKGWESRLWRLEDKHLREGSSVRQFGMPRPLRIRHRRRRSMCFHHWLQTVPRFAVNNENLIMTYRAITL